ncbi:cationic amino acid transporter 1-like [Macadamia integrifolia]|uniref:cationic amino acid transporter 1-like n=1 Tax=Macadamia integrifolia TaxID=60698 RepID=UPI001C4FF478|nr:cationic amino acid transporter 1-like [Macadamia integrifolia]
MWKLGIVLPSGYESPLHKGGNGKLSSLAIAYCLIRKKKKKKKKHGQRRLCGRTSGYNILWFTCSFDWSLHCSRNNAGALKGMTTALLSIAIGQARYLTHFARTHMVLQWFAQVHEKTGTLMNATIIVLIAIAIIAFFTSLGILSNLVSISTLFIFMMVAIALLVRHYYASGVTKPVHRNILILCLTLIIGSSFATAACWGISSTGWIGYAIAVPIWFLATLALCLFVPKAREPKLSFLNDTPSCVPISATC